ncbi:ATP-binding protein [bacterium]|nr:ATP-binding protein [bacterium]
MWINRDCSNKILDAVKMRPAVLVTGMRQAGKTSLLKHLFPDAEYITLDSTLLAKEAEENPKAFLSRFDNAKNVIIDEIQYAPHLFRELKIDIDEHRQRNGKWILTGSQQFSLMNHVTESLAGRIRVVELEPLSAHEILNAGIAFSTNTIVGRGGFPELWGEQALNSDEFYADYIKTYLERDVRSLTNVVHLRDFHRLIQFVALRSGSLLNISELAKDVAVAPNTVKSWISVLEASGIITLLPPFSGNIGKRLIKAPKIYLSDTGLLTHLLHIQPDQNLSDFPAYGHMWENFVMSELKKTIVEQPGNGLFYYRDSNGVEIDFLIVRNNVVYMIEAKSAEQPDGRKLNFKKVAVVLKEKKYKTESILVAPISEGEISLKDYRIVNPAMLKIFR